MISDFVQSKDLWVILPIALMTLTPPGSILTMIQAGDVAANYCILQSLPNKIMQRKWIKVSNKQTKLKFISTSSF